MKQNAWSRRAVMAGLGGAALAEGAGRKLRMGVVGGRFGASFSFHEHPNAVVAAV